MVHVLNLQFQYEKILDECEFQIPKKYARLTVESAQWIMEKIHVFNRNKKNNVKIQSICKEYLNSIENNYNIEFMLE